jgi:hypothetical protein
MADNFSWLNPHLSIALNLAGGRAFETTAQRSRLEQVAAVAADLSALVREGTLWRGAVHSRRKASSRFSTRR